MVNKSIKDDILYRIRELSPDICNNMLALGLDVDDWNGIYQRLQCIEKIIKYKFNLKEV